VAWTAPVTWTTSVALSVSRLNEQLRDNSLYLKGLADSHKTQHASGGTDILYYKRQAMWFIAGNLATGATQSATIIYRGPSATIIRADARVETAPASQAIILDIHLNGTTIWSTQANRVQIAASATSGTRTTFNTTALADGDC
jgi:hypothetical protein